MDPYRRLPPVDELITSHRGRLPCLLLTAVVRQTLAEARALIGAGEAVDVDEMLDLAIGRVARPDRGVINATGVLLHTNLGRAAWAADAINAAMNIASRPSALEFDLETGARGGRGDHVLELLRLLTGAEDAFVVNNNAGALLLCLATLAQGLSVPVSRGELIEIGGSYRLPEVITASGAATVEIGTTNRTRLDDYRTALQVHKCGALLKVHPSNYTVDGFADSPATKDLALLAAEYDVPLVFDIGSGLLAHEAPWAPQPTPAWLRGEPSAKESLLDGVGLVTFSGDKLVGGPQSGIIVGRHDLVSRLRRHPLARALRVDAVTLAALGATLDAYADCDLTRIPLWAMALADLESIDNRARGVASALGGAVRAGSSTLGAGSAPGATIPSALVWLDEEDGLFDRLLSLETPVVATRRQGSLVLDLRSVLPNEDQAVIDAVLKCR